LIKVFIIMGSHIEIKGQSYLFLIFGLRTNWDAKTM
jgi:hypothetical protein